MGVFAARDVSQEETAICVVDRDGTTLAEAKVPTCPETIADWFAERVTDLERVGIETGPLAVWLWNALTARQVPIVCLDARHANAVLKVMPYKTDRHDARGPAQIVRAGWFKAVQIKSYDAYVNQALLTAGEALIGMRGWTQALVFLVEGATAKPWAEVFSAHLVEGQGGRPDAGAPLARRDRAGPRVHVRRAARSRPSGCSMRTTGARSRPSASSPPAILERTRSPQRAREFYLASTSDQNFMDRLGDQIVRTGGRQWDAIWDDGDSLKAGLNTDSTSRRTGAS